ncbi:MAG: VanZ family protein [bacterium]|nr:VanZ family protein [bacterium]
MLRLRWIFRAAFFCALLGIWVLAIMPAPPAIGSSYDKANHAFAFLVLGVLARMAWPRAGASRVPGLLLLFGILIEVVQYFVGRDASVFDVMADGVGLALAVCVMLFVRPLLARYLPDQHA